MDHHCDDPYMKTRNRQDMKKTGIFKKRFILFGDPGFISQQKCFHQGCFVRYRKTLIRFFDELVPQMIEERRSEEHTSELQSRGHLVCRLLHENKKYTRE